MKKEELKPLYEKILSWEPTRSLSNEEEAEVRGDPEAFELWKLHREATLLGRRMQKERQAALLLDSDAAFLHRLHKRIGHERAAPRRPGLPSTLRGGLLAAGLAATAAFVWIAQPFSLWMNPRLADPALQGAPRSPQSGLLAKAPEGRPQASKASLPPPKALASSPQDAASRPSSESITIAAEDEDPLEMILNAESRQEIEVAAETPKNEDASESLPTEGGIAETPAPTEALAALQNEEGMVSSLASALAGDPSPISQRLPESLDGLDFLLSKETEIF